MRAPARTSPPVAGSCRSCSNSRFSRPPFFELQTLLLLFPASTLPSRLGVLRAGSSGYRIAPHEGAPYALPQPARTSARSSRREQRRRGSRRRTRERAEPRKRHACHVSCLPQTTCRTPCSPALIARALSYIKEALAPRMFLPQDVEYSFSRDLNHRVQANFCAKLRLSESGERHGQHEPLLRVGDSPERRARPPEIQLAPVSCYPRTSRSHQHPGIRGDCYHPVTFGQLGSLWLLPPLPTI